MYRVGTGLDFHRLLPDKDRPLILGGYIIESELALQGHSDADILLHSISDAILGALSLGDIGDYFPDTDMAHKNMDSTIIVKKALQLIKEKNYSLVNMDATIIGEGPKIAPHREQIRKSLSKILCIKLENVSVKATTTEKMGAIGRQEGIGVITTVLVQKIS
ncbi:MAG: 2-C-methyl-D-erythritol 2,4-cyclodiphosphate synthase [Leptospiraceae bacterium]|nr:2-C-methyl-D-erythritol 2,4-cyclodiphosphate synthase [Leptospiraceae bacterium]MCP5497431.1 2-C-methyl-D-erythritol 2,4-cyclodiphosphate synthase [Leptospiraceae bacterium]